MRAIRTRPDSACARALALAVAAAIVLNLNIAAAQSPNQDRQTGRWDMWGPGHMEPDMRQRMVRHWTFMHRGIPVVCSGARNPLSSDAQTIDEGRALYQEKCASCHGATGAGDGEQADTLNPSPALLAYMIQMPISVDEFMLWTISDGGAAFGTALPAFKDVLTKDQIWKIVTYMRAGFPTAQAQQRGLSL